MKIPQKILVIQTAFIGDVILATSLVEAIHTNFPNAEIHFLVRKGNEGIFLNHPFINKVLIWDKKYRKISNMYFIIKQLRNENYSMVFNLQRFLSSGIFTVFAKSKITIGFDKNPLSFLFSKKIKHEIGLSNYRHETQRNNSLLEAIGISNPNTNTKIYPSVVDFKNVEKYKNEEYLVIAPASVWFTKQFPENKWLELINKLENRFKILFIGSKDDKELADRIISKCNDKKTLNLCGSLSLLESAALLKDAKRVFVNDSAPMHLASGINAATTAIFCSTIPAFGFGPTSENSRIIETKEVLNCRPCGLHGKKECPQNHFKCANTVDVNTIISTID